MSTVRVCEELTDASVRQLVTGWYAALDRHDPIENLLPFLVSDGLVMFLYEGTSKELDGFRAWYADATRRFSDETHTALSVDVRLHAPLSAEVELVVNWRARKRSSSVHSSQWLDCDEYQTWTVALEDGTPCIRTYAVHGRAPSHP